LSLDSSFAEKLGNRKKNYYRLVWEGADLEKRERAFSVLYHSRMTPEQANRMSGARPGTHSELIEILITKTPGSVLQATYVSTPTSDAALPQVPDLIQKINFLGFLATVEGSGITHGVP
jgi:hypothetical protein